MAIPRTLVLLVLMWLLCDGGLACFSGQRNTAKVNENPFTEWSDWSECDLPCGDGKQTRSRSSIVVPQEREVQSRACGVSCAETFRWSDWQDWSNCSLSCGSQGVRSRFRDCRRISDGTVETRRVACPGSWVEAEPCNVFECPPVYLWTPWSDWAQCTQTCGQGGQQSRERLCQTDKLVGAASENCGESAGNETRPCNEETPCPSVAEWQPWSEWSSCPVTCSGSVVTRTRERRCNPDRSPSLCIMPDVAAETEKRDCATSACPVVHGGWNHWNPWSNCLVTCGWGFRVRNRLCNNPPPSNGGSDCGSTSAGYERCLGGECPVDGQWGSWAPCTNVEGSHCTTNPRDQCSAGVAMYCRLCDNPKPENGGSACATGLASDRRECWNMDACDNSVVQPPMNFTVVGFLNTTDLLVTWIRAPFGVPASSFFITWTVSGTDTVGDAEIPAAPQEQQKTLGEGYTHWIRGLASNSVLDISIATRSTAGGLQRISAPRKESFQVSRVDGGWGEWGQYSSCSPTADCNIPGSIRRSRQCDSPAPTNRGRTCPGSDTEISRCFHPC